MLCLFSCLLHTICIVLLSFVWFAIVLTYSVAGSVQAEDNCIRQIWEATNHGFRQFKSMVETIRKCSKRCQWKTWEARDFSCCNRFSLFQGAWFASYWILSYGEHSHSSSWSQWGDYFLLVASVFSSLVDETQDTICFILGKHLPFMSWDVNSWTVCSCAVPEQGWISERNFHLWIYYQSICILCWICERWSF